MLSAISGLLFTVFMGIALAAGYDIWERASFYDRAVEVEGVIEGFRCPKKARSTCDVRVQYQLKGAKFSFEESHDPSPWFRTGDKVQVAYQVGRPGFIEARLVDWPFRSVNVVPLILGVGGAIPSGFVLWTALLTRH